jgi:NAD+ synthase (glutamine-hydrolysing)
VASVGDIAANIRETISLAKRGHKEACGMELC